ncbi:MAG: hypothetical protein RMN51_01860 [Verrucomicrobiota bacterium]|nr:hypothetical protein [Limisphaera sp.]MDW8380845.1 hypothetical protein [Verrucomicrobiota bacterium]
MATTSQQRERNIFIARYISLWIGFLILIGFTRTVRHYAKLTEIGHDQYWPGHGLVQLPHARCSAGLRDKPESQELTVRIGGPGLPDMCGQLRSAQA